MDDRAVRRAGLDYWDAVTIKRHRDLEELYQSLPGGRFIYFTTKAECSFWDWQFQNDDRLIFGPETRGLPEALLKENWDRCLKIPMSNPKVRSLNLANSVAVALYEAIRQVAR
jgi:tRNA (cytidine/uridine-2'-O-)-methyltransferase